MRLSKSTQDRVRQIVRGLFADGKTPCMHYGIDPARIEQIEVANPHVSKQGVPLVHPLNGHLERQ